MHHYQKFTTTRKHELKAAPCETWETCTDTRHGRRSAEEQAVTSATQRRAQAVLHVDPDSLDIFAATEPRKQPADIYQVPGGSSVHQLFAGPLSFGQTLG